MSIPVHICHWQPNKKLQIIHHPTDSQLINGRTLSTKFLSIVLNEVWSENPGPLANICFLYHVVDDLWATHTKITSGQHVTSLLSTQIISWYSNRKFRLVDANEWDVLWDSNVSWYHVDPNVSCAYAEAQDITSYTILCPLWNFSSMICRKYLLRGKISTFDI